MRSLAFYTFLLAPLLDLAACQTPLFPSEDVFYSQPANISAYDVGGIVRSRQISNTIQGTFGTFTVGSAYQFMYRSTDTFGSAVGDVMTFLTPSGLNADNTKLLVYSVAYDSPNINCSPSYTLRPGANNTAGADPILIQAALNNGWYVVTSDYEGLRAQFTVGLQSGHAVLDAIRASLTSEARSLTGLSASARYAMFGYLGGSLASEWAAELVSSYAPDLTGFVGSAIGGLTPNVTQVLITVNGQAGGGLSFAGSLGIAQAYSNFSAWLDANVIASRRAEFNYIGGGCLNETTARGNGQDFFSYFYNGTGILDDATFRTVTSGSGQQGVHGVPNQPLYIFKGTQDEISPVNDTDALVFKYCEEGVRIQYERNSATNHGEEGIVGVPGAFQWLSDRFNGFPLLLNNNFFNCEIENITVPGLSAVNAVGVFGSTIAAELTTLLASASTAIDPPASSTTTPSASSTFTSTMPTTGTFTYHGGAGGNKKGNGHREGHKQVPKKGLKSGFGRVKGQNRGHGWY